MGLVGRAELINDHYSLPTKNWRGGGGVGMRKAKAKRAKRGVGFCISIEYRIDLIWVRCRQLASEVAENGWRTTHHQTYLQARPGQGGIFQCQDDNLMEGEMNDHRNIVICRRIYHNLLALGLGQGNSMNGRC